MKNFHLNSLYCFVPYMHSSICMEPLPWDVEYAQHMECMHSSFWSLLVPIGQKKLDS